VVRSVAEVIKGWVYLLALVTGGNYVRKARLQRLGKGAKILPTVFFKYPELIQIGENSFINHLCSVWASPGGPITIGSNVLFGPCASIFSSNHGTARSGLIRNQPGQDAPIEIGDFAVDASAHTATVCGKSLHLTPTEFDLLLYMARNAGKALTHRALLTAVWGGQSAHQPEYLRVFIGQLRRKLEAEGPRQYIQTEPWVGYRFLPEGVPE